MKSTIMILAALASGLSVAGCSSQPTPKLEPGSPAATVGAKRSRPVVAERPARMYIWAGFSEKDCRAVTSKFAVTQAPTKGTVSFRPNQPTKIQHSGSGKCIGTRLAGTGIYYTAHKGQSGSDQFSVTATPPSGQTVTKSFQVEIVE